ncbi:MAG: glutamine-synthetase adenylyltransferase [Acidobacteriota bacterium]
MLLKPSRGWEEILAQHSRVWAEEARKHENWLRGLRLEGACTREHYREALEGIEFREEAVAEFRRRSLVRVLLRDVLGYGSLGEITGEISALAEAILGWSYERIRGEVVGQYGEARREDGRRCGLSILALGKLGGEELNYSSDIDLMYVYEAGGETEGPSGVSHREFFAKIAQRQAQFLGAYTGEGICYRVDLRLRPEGSLGEIAISRESAEAYYRLRARDWELQMMIKARVVAGEAEPGEALIEMVEPLTYRTTTDFSAIEAVSATRVRWNEKLANRRLQGGATEIKLTRGGIRDIEFLVQCLQRLHGGREKWVRKPGTMIALSRLHDKGLIKGSEFDALMEAYVFLRHLEHRLQVMEDRQTHVMPEEWSEIESLARRMPRLQLGVENTAARLLEKLKGHLGAVESIYNRIIHGHSIEPEPVEEISSHANRTQLQRLEEQLAGRWGVGVLGERQLERDWQELAALSPWLADELIREPEWLEELRALGQAEPGPVRWSEEVSLRKAYRRRQFRILCESALRGRGVFETMGAMSDLADGVIGHCHELAMAEQGEWLRGSGHPMLVVALGRLGLREFDVASDADLVFVLPNEAAGEMEAWTRVASRMIELLTAYTGEGVIFSVDARLRPYGREGDLVQTKKSFIEYFSHQAEAWEGIAYMKARGVAGPGERATEFLAELQRVDWRRYGQSQRSKKQLGEMRARLEREQGRDNPLKAGRGGFYDIDFLLLYLRLRSAGIFFRVLNTLERIEVIEQMGHLEAEDAAFLREATLFYRSIDHGLRLHSGQSPHHLPGATAGREALEVLLRKWMPGRRRDGNLETELERMRERTRETFERLFA